MLKIAQEDLSSIELLEKTKNFNSLFKLTYSVIHTLCEAYVLLDKVKAKNHICLFVYLCYYNNEFDWDFFEDMRMRRNGLHYYGNFVSRDFWLNSNEQLFYYVNLLHNKIVNRLH